MKKTYRLIIKTTILFVLCFQLTISSFALAKEPAVSSGTPRDYALEIVRLVNDDDKNCPWDDTTVLLPPLPLYDFNGNINGYIYNLSTGQKDTGFVQIFYIDGVCSLVGFSYEGRHYIENMLGAYAEKSLARYNATQMKIVYAGGMDYLLESLSNVEYYNLNEQAFVSSGCLAAMKSEYNQFSNKILTDEMRIQSETATRAATGTGVQRYVLGANNLDIVVTSDFSGRTIGNHAVGGHCTPTAATTIIKYWANRRGFSNLYYNSDWWVFSSLYVNMNTRDINNINPETQSGTLSPDIIPGLINYSEQIRGVPVVAYMCVGDGADEVVTFELAKGCINLERPFIALQDDHAMACFGYYTVGGRKQLIVANGWTRAWIFQSFDSLDFLQYHYVRWV